jgi:hypothetical protein
MRKRETGLSKAQRLVREGEAIVIRQRTLVLELGDNIKQAEELLKTFEATLKTLRKDLLATERREKN